MTGRACRAPRQHPRMRGMHDSGQWRRLVRCGSLVIGPEGVAKGWADRYEAGLLTDSDRFDRAGAQGSPGR
jgi:hypothetical protein